jgi:hypothetical protein
VAVSRAELWAGHRSFVDGELLAQGLAVAGDKEGREPEHVKQECDYGARLWPDPAGRSITWPADEVLAKDSLTHDCPACSWNFPSEIGRHQSAVFSRRRFVLALRQVGHWRPITPAAPPPDGILRDPFTHWLEDWPS